MSGTFAKSLVHIIALCCFLGASEAIPRDVAVRQRTHAARETHSRADEVSQYENKTESLNLPVRILKLHDYLWKEVEQSLEGLFEAAMGPEVAYWKGRNLSCRDVAHTVRSLYDVFPHSVRVVLIRNQTWHFLEAVPGGEAQRQQQQQPGARGSDPGRAEAAAAGGGQRGGARYDWPPLAASVYGSCPSPCQAQLEKLHGVISATMRAWRERHHYPHAAPGGPYDLPDMVFVVNAADNMQRFGANARAPLLSLLKYWNVPWGPAAEGATATPHAADPDAQAKSGAPADAAGGPDPATAPTRPTVSLGRIGGRLLKPLALPSAIAATEPVPYVPGGQSGAGRRVAGKRQRQRQRQRQQQRQSQPLQKRKLYAFAREDEAGSHRTAATEAEEATASELRRRGLLASQHPHPHHRGPREQDAPAPAAAAAAVTSPAAQASYSRSLHSVGAAGYAGAPDPLWEAVRTFVASRGPDLPPGVQLHWAHPPGARRPPTPFPPPPSGDGVGEREPFRSHYPDPIRPPYDMDLLLPTMAVVPKSLSFVPWKAKKDIAFFSGVAFCPLYTTLHPICPRALLANVSAAGWYPGDLDVRLVRPFRGRLGSQGGYRRRVAIRQHAPTPPAEHARYRYLLQLDGLTASYRMGVLMATNSAILKNRSPYIEYYSRLLVPGAHYLEFWRDPDDPLDVLGVLREARRLAAEDPEGVAAAVAANQAVVARYLARIPRLVYARAVMLAYHALVPDMDACVADLLGHLEDSGRPLPYAPPSPPPPPPPRPPPSPRRRRRRRQEVIRSQQGAGEVQDDGLGVAGQGEGDAGGGR